MIDAREGMEPWNKGTKGLMPEPWNKGKACGNSVSGHYGILHRKSNDKWTVRIHNKKYGSFTDLDEAIKRRDEVLLRLGLPKAA